MPIMHVDASPAVTCGYQTQRPAHPPQRSRVPAVRVITGTDYYQCASPQISRAIKLFPSDSTKSRMQATSRQWECISAIAMAIGRCMASPSGPPQRQNLTRTLLHQEREVACAMKEALDDDMGVAPSMPSSAPRVRARSRRPTDIVTTPVAGRGAGENQALRDELEQLRSAQTHWEASIGGKRCQRQDSRLKRHMPPRCCYNKEEADARYPRVEDAGDIQSRR